MHFNVTGLLSIGKIVKNKILASITILSFKGSNMIKISELGTNLGEYLLNGDLLGLKFNKNSKIMLLLPFPTTSNTWLV